MQHQNKAGNLLPQDGPQGVPVHLVRAIDHIRRARRHIDVQTTQLGGLPERTRKVYFNMLQSAISDVTEAETSCCDVMAGLLIIQTGGPDDDEG